MSLENSSSSQNAIACLEQNSDSSDALPAIALLPWGNVIEDYLDSLGISLKAFCTELTGGWLFGYIDALQSVGVRTVLICVSKEVKHITRDIHTPSGATVYFLPASFLHTFVRWIINPTAGQAVQENSFWKWLKSPFIRSLSDIEPYLATPFFKLRQVIQSENCRAILCQEYEYPRFDYCVLLGKWLKLPVYASFQGGNFQTSRLEQITRPYTLKICDGLIVPTQTEINRLQQKYQYPLEKIAKIFNPLDLDLWLGNSARELKPLLRHQVRQELGIDSASLIIICHGRIDIRRKGLDVLLAAWEQICRQDVAPAPIYLLLIGAGQNTDEFRTLLANYGFTNVIWIDQYIRDRDRMIRYLAAADVYVLSSRNEGFPVAPLEAMACGLPIVATAVPGIPDILENEETSGGLRVPCENPEQLALALEKLLIDRSLRERMGELARERIIEAFSLTSVGKRMKDFLLSAH